MKRLTILRHAKSSWDDLALDDFERPLNDRGRKAARRIGAELTRRHMRFDLVVASPAVRVRETIQGLMQGRAEGEFPVRFDPGIYLASAATLLAMVCAMPAGVQAPLLVGHNPGLHELLLQLAGADERGLRTRLAAKFPTAALVVVEIDVNSWAEVKPGAGKLVELILPRELD